MGFTMSFENRRFFRIKYPVDFRPELIIDGHIYKLVDVSVSGMRFIGTNVKNLEVGNLIVATIGFQTGARVTVRGNIVRIIDDYVMVNFENHIPKKVLKDEADRLIDSYGAVPSSEPE